MAGFNQNALEFSKAHLDEQKQAIFDTLPYIVRIDLTNASTGDPQAVDLFADYIKGIDGHAFDVVGNHYSVSFKSRLPSEMPLDLRLEAIKLTDTASHYNNKTGFIYKGDRYAFDGFADINVQWIDGRNYVFLGSEIQALSLCYRSDENELVRQVKEKKSTDRNGNPFFSGKYYVFLDRERFCKYINWLCQYRMSYQNKVGEQ